MQVCTHTYISGFIFEGVLASHIFLRDAHVYQNDLAMRNTVDVGREKLFAIRLQSVSG
jgi:hypothetical protein